MAQHGRKSVSSKQLRRTTQRMERSTIGTHAAGPRTTRRTNARGANVDFSNTRRSTRARRGEVNTITPRTRTGESRSAYSRRMNSGREVADLPKRRFARGIIIAVIVVALIAALAVGAGMLAYSATVNSGHALRDSDAQSALTTVSKPESTPYYILITVELGAVSKPLSNNGPDFIELVRVDEANAKVTLINVPCELKYATSTTSSSRIADIAASGDAALIEAVADFFDVDIAHFVKVTQSDFVSMVDAIGGVDMTLSEEIDDPHAGSIYIPSGATTLDGASSLVYLRATNFSGGIETRMANQNAFAASFFEKLFANGAISFASRLDSINGYIQTDMTTDNLMSINSHVGAISASNMVQATISGYTDTPDSLIEGTTYFVGSSSGTATLMAQIDKDGSLPASTSTTTTVDPASFQIEVQNGGGVTGAAASTASILTSQGFVVTKQGNADQQIYTETLIVYDKAEAQAQAQAVCDALGYGRVVYGQGYYEYDTNVLVMVGSDFKPTS